MLLLASPDGNIFFRFWHYFRNRIVTAYVSTGQVAWHKMQRRILLIKFYGMNKHILQWISGILFFVWAMVYLFAQPDNNLYNALGLIFSLAFLFCMLVYEHKDHRLRRRIAKHRRNRLKNQTAE